jgi:hypothetical protein
MSAPKRIMALAAPGEELDFASDCRHGRQSTALLIDLLVVGPGGRKPPTKRL